MKYPTTINLLVIVLLLMAVSLLGISGPVLPAWDNPPDASSDIISFDSSFVVYRVSDGDYLSKIADDFGIPMAEIMKTNEINPKSAKIYIGQELKIPTRGRTNEVLKARKKRIMLDSNNELAALEKDLGALEYRLNHLKFEMDSLQHAIKELEKKELLGDDANFDESDMSALLRQMEKAKEIGLKKKALESHLERREFEFLAKNQEATELNVDIANLKNNLEKKAQSASEKPEIPAEAYPDMENDDIELAVVPDRSMEEIDRALNAVDSTLDANSAANAQDQKGKSPSGFQTANKVEVEYEIQEYKEPKAEEFESNFNKFDIADLSNADDVEERPVDFKGRRKQKPSEQRLKAKSKRKRARRSDRSYMKGKGDNEDFKGLEEVDVSYEMDSIRRIKAEFYLSRAITEIDRRQYKKADRMVDKSLRLNPDNLDARILQGDISATFGFDEKAIKQYDHALALDSGMPQIYYNRAHCYLTLEKKEKAYHDFSRAVELDQKYILAYAGRASISVDINDFEAAISDYTKIIKMNRHFIPAYKGRGVAYMELGAYDEAMADFNFILEMTPNEPAIYYKRGLVKILTDQLYEACFDLWTAAEMGYREANKAVKKYCD